MVLDEKEQEVLKRLFEKHPNRPAKILKELETEAGMSWKRDEKAFRLVQQELAAPVAGPELYAVYFGEAGSSLKGVTPYGRQPTGQRYNVPISGAHGSTTQERGAFKVFSITEATTELRS